MKNENMYIVRKMVRAYNAQDAIKKESKIPVHEVFLVEDSFKEGVFETIKSIKEKSRLGF